MSFQKCPICLGTGDNPFILELPRSTWPCPTCKGKRIINEANGEPPITQEQLNILESLLSMTHAINPRENDSKI